MGEFNLYQPFELDAEDSPWAKNQGLHPFNVQIVIESGAVECRRSDCDPADDAVHELFTSARMVAEIYTCCWARDEPHAVKIATDRLAEYKAMKP
jgi:hypothetical protein